MIKPIVKDLKILTQKSEPFVLGEDNSLIIDLLDTAIAHKQKCAGLACIQIGVAKRVILVRKNEDDFMIMINPTIIKKSNETYTTQEGCLSLDGKRTVKRHKSIKVIYTTLNGKKKAQEFNDYTAQIIQHEYDHLNGILI